MNNPRILLDLDCVLADFVTGCSIVWGLAPEKVMSHWPAGTYPMNHALALALNETPPLSNTRFWNRLNGNARFWATLPVLPWFDFLMRGIRQLTDDWHIVSAPSHCPTSYQGKVDWLKDKFGEKFDRFALTPHKEIFSRPGVILVDDNEVNVEKFRKGGGEAVLFPAHHNCLHEFKGEPLSYVLPQINYLFRRYKDQPDASSQVVSEGVA